MLDRPTDRTPDVGRAALVLLVPWDDTVRPATRFVLDASLERVAVGRRSANRLVLPGVHVSRRHALLSHRDRAWWITDEGSTGGTFVNGERVTEKRLGHGDVVQIGECVLQYLAPEHAEKDYPRLARALTETDWLTGAPTRASLIAQLDAVLSSAAPARGAVIVVDVDRLAPLDYDRGIDAGDQVLRDVFARLCALAAGNGESDVHRLGPRNDAFAVWLDGAGLAEAREFARMALAEIAAMTVSHGGHTMSVTASAGVVPASETFTRGQDWLDDARDAAREALRQGGNRAHTP